jgi:uncharacterized membrane protein
LIRVVEQGPLGQASGFGGPPVGAFPPPPTQPPGKASGLAIAAMVVGIIAAPSGFCLGLIGLIFAIVGVVLSRMELNKIARGEAPAEGHRYAKIGFWCSIAGFIGFGVSIILYVLLVIAQLMLGSMDQSGSYP